MWITPGPLPAGELVGLLVLGAVVVWAAVHLALRGEAPGRPRRGSRRPLRLLAVWFAPLVLVALVVRGAWRATLVLSLALAVYVGVLRWRGARHGA